MVPCMQACSDTHMQTASGYVYIYIYIVYSMCVVAVQTLGIVWCPKLPFTSPWALFKATFLNNQTWSKAFVARVVPAAAALAF